MIVWAGRDKAALDDEGLIERYETDRARLIADLTSIARRHARQLN